MNLVFQKTRELGEALMQSEEYTAMKALEDRAMGNEEAAMTMGKFIETKQALEELLMSDDPDAEALRALSAQMDELQEHLQLIDDIHQLTEARNAFSSLIEQVNGVLRFIITGEMPDGEEEEGCGGNCGACGGCGGHHHVH